jgi:hypothetical protein
MAMHDRLGLARQPPPAVRLAYGTDLIDDLESVCRGVSVGSRPRGLMDRKGNLRHGPNRESVCRGMQCEILFQRVVGSMDWCVDAPGLELSLVNHCTYVYVRTPCRVRHGDYTWLHQLLLTRRNTYGVVAI